MWFIQNMDNYFRNIGSWLNGKIANLILEKPPNLYLSSFKAISRLQEITKMNS